MKTKPNITIATIPLSAYEGISAEVVHCGEDNNIYIYFKDGDRSVAFGINAWRLTKDDTIKLAKALSEATLYTKQ